MNKRTRTVIIIIAFLLSVASVGLVAAMIIPSADELLTRSVETLEEVTDGHAIVDVILEMPDETLSGRFEVWGALSEEPDGRPSMRVEVLEASKDDLVGVTAVSDGNQSWLYHPGRNTVIVGRAEEMAPLIAEKMTEYEGAWEHEGNFDPQSTEHPETPAEVVAKFLEYFMAERNGQEQVADSDAYLIRLVPIAEQMPEEIRATGGFVNLWLRTSDQLPIAIEYAEGAFGYGKIQTSNVGINTGLDQSIFTFDIPEGTQVIEAIELIEVWEEKQLSTEQVEFEALTPTELPESAVPGERQQIAGTVVQRFNLPDDQSFYVAQGLGMPVDSPTEATTTETVNVRGIEATLFTNDGATRSLLAWKEEDFVFLVGGDLSPEQAMAIAESLQ